MFCAFTYMAWYEYSSVCFTGWCPSGAVTYCLCCCSWFVVSSSVKLLHLVSGLTLTDTILMSASFYWPVWLQFDPQRLYWHTHIKISSSPSDLPLIFCSKEMNGCIQTFAYWRISTELQFPNSVCHHKGREREEVAKVKNAHENKKKHKRGC